MPNPYLPPRDAKPERVRISVRLEKGETEELEQIAALWNRIDEELGRKRRSEWRPASLIELMVRVGMSEFWRQIGGKPAPDESEKALIRRAVAAAVKQEEAAAK